MYGHAHGMKEVGIKLGCKWRGFGGRAKELDGGTLVPRKCATDYDVKSNLKNETNIYVLESNMRFTTLSHFYNKTTKYNSQS